MDFSKLKLVTYRTVCESVSDEEQPIEPVKDRVRASSFNINELIQKEELIRMREDRRVDWRTELEEENKKEHPYVDVMPGGETEKDIIKTLRRKKKVEESILTEGNPTTRMMTKANTKVTGNISADRGNDETQNRKNRKQLELKLRKRIGGFQKGVGEYKYQDEDGEGTGREVSYQVTKPDTMSKRRFGKLVRRTGREAGQESVITKDTNKPAKLHSVEKGSKDPSVTAGKTTPGKHPTQDGETSGTDVRGGKLPKTNTKPSYHYEQREQN